MSIARMDDPPTRRKELVKKLVHYQDLGCQVPIISDETPIEELEVMNMVLSKKYYDDQLVRLGNDIILMFGLVMYKLCADYAI